MPVRSMILQEAMEKEAVITAVKPDEIVKAMKKSMNTCKLTRFKSTAECSKFYSAFFLSTLADGIQPTIEQWGTIYTSLLGQDTFCADLALYMSMFQPAIYTGIFAPLWNLVQSELANMEKNKVRYLSLTRAMFTTIQMRMNGVGEIVKSQVTDPEILKFVTVVDQVLAKYIFDLTTLTQEELAKDVKPDDIAVQVRGDVELSESWQDFLNLMESADEWIKNRTDYYLRDTLNEGIVSNAKEHAKSMVVAAKKAERDFDEFVMKKVKKIREERRNKKHSEMVGESLRVMREIKRLLRTGGIALLSPTWAAITFIISVVYDRHTDKKDRAVLVGQLRDELEIVDEKIQMAERNGDDKARIELIRFRQKLQREYERIQRTRFDAQTRDRMRNN